MVSCQSTVAFRLFRSRFHVRFGSLTMAPDPTEVAELVEPARSAFQSGGGRHAIIVELPAGLPRVMADRPRIA